MNEEKFFCCCNILKILEEKAKEVRESLVKNENANNENLYGFDFGVETILSILKAIIDSAENDEEILVHSDKLNPDYEMEEFDLHDLLKHFNCRITMQNNKDFECSLGNEVD